MIAMTAAHRIPLDVIRVIVSYVDDKDVRRASRRSRHLLALLFTESTRSASSRHRQRQAGYHDQDLERFGLLPVQAISTQAQNR